MKPHSVEVPDVYLTPTSKRAYLAGYYDGYRAGWDDDKPFAPVVVLMLGLFTGAAGASIAWLLVLWLAGCQP
jgi:hypothetical protein